MKIYTKTGDDGSTALFAGGRVPKTHLRVETYGTVDELNAVLGLVRAHKPDSDDWLAQIQRQLFHLGADLATPQDAKSDWVVRVDAAQVAWLEEIIDHMTAELPPLTSFILPGGTLAAAQLHVARTVCRRAERLAVALAAHEAIGDHVLPYLNRLSDALFMLARWENVKAGAAEVTWSGR
ncbi:MAG TPA: cob(I)yrinic acid a,c-diamide adenosyltransferase [Spirillospora sp.]|nr:cob(I)yrinic acid a,c-diamide adenosyltransferase [Spirillospora sp.]